jgi:GTP-binding protein EngB required for normal cell division
MSGRQGPLSGLAARAAAIEAAVDAAGDFLDPALATRAHTGVDRSLQRLQLGTDHTVVALVGATGSGKSSLFNALAGMEIAETGARRPQTREPMSVLWGDGSEDLLDWLQVPGSRRMRRESVLDADRQAPLNGLVLLDLPDHDSTETVHRVEMDRLVQMVDLLVWVVDPQKYADDALHTGYLQRMTSYASVMIVVLNQIDKLGPEEAQTCYTDLRRLLDGDGLETVHLLPVSARRGDGVSELRDALARVVRNRGAVTERAWVDLEGVSADLAASLAPSEPDDVPGAERFVADLSAAAGVPAVLDVLATEYRRRGWSRAGWPLVSWAHRWRSRGGVGAAVDQQDLRMVATALRPATAPAQRAEVQLAVDRVLDGSVTGLPPRWADGVRAARPGDGLVDELDDAVAGVDLELAPPPWWTAVAVLHHVLVAIAAIGLVWLLVAGVGAVFGADLSPGVPLAMLLLGLLGGAALAVAVASALRMGARTRCAEAEASLQQAVGQVAETRVLAPVRDVLARHRRARLALAGALIAAPQPQDDAPPVAVDEPAPV